MKLEILIIAGLLIGCSSAKKADQTASPTVAYELTRPADRAELPAVLTNVSGLTYYQPGKLACVQHELGSIFFYDLKKKRVANEQVFMPGGDYQDVAFAHGRMYVLRSDGELFWTEPDESSVKTLGNGPQTHHIKINLPGKVTVAGLGYDPKLDALVLAVNASDQAETNKPTYYYGLKTDGFYAGPKLKQADIQAIDASAEKEIKPSGLAVQPQSRDYYWLASVGHRLVVTSQGGTVKAVLKLDSTLFSKPEGICFAPDGTLFIANAGNGKPGYVLQFTPVKIAN